MGRPFRSFEEAWAHFLAREEGLESFLDELSEEAGTTVLVWLVPLDRSLAGRVRELQGELARFDWLTPLPDHFLHVTLAPPDVAQPGEALRGLASFRIRLARVNCFHDAVVVEADGAGLREAAGRLGTPLEFFLPHLSIAYANRRNRPDELRRVLLPLRDTEVGEQRVEEVRLVEVAASRSAILSPWRVVESARLSG